MESERGRLEEEEIEKESEVKGHTDSLQGIQTKRLW